MNNKAQFTPLKKAVHAIPMLYAEAFAGSNNKEFVVELYKDARLLETAAPAMYDRHKDNHGMVQEALRYLYEGEYEEVKCLLNHIALNSKHAVRQAEGRQA